MQNFIFGSNDEPTPTHQRSDGSKSPNAFGYISPGGAREYNLSCDEAQQRYAADNFEGKIIPPSIDKAIIPEEIVTPEVIEDPRRTGKAGTISELAKERIEKHERWLEELGISLPPPVYAAGTRVLDIGYQNLAASRQEWDSLPTLKEAAANIGDAIRAEDRKDIRVQVLGLTMGEDGLLHTGHGAYPLERQSLGQLLSLIKLDPTWLSEHFRQVNDFESAFPRGYQMMMALDPETRSYVFQRQIGRAKPRELVLRTRVSGGQRSVFGVVSPTYSPFDADKVLQVIGQALGNKGYRAEAIYNSNNTNLEVNVTSHAPSDLKDFAAGDVFKLGYTFKSNDAGGGSFNGGTSAWRNRCLNMIIIGEGRGAQFTVIHKGTDHNSAMRKAIKQLHTQTRWSRDVFARFQKDWKLLGETDISDVTLWGKTFKDAPQALRWGVTKGKIKATGANKVLAEYLEKAWREEPGETLADMVNAVTRAAHTGTDWNTVIRSELEVLAGRQLVPVLVKAARA